MSEFAEVIRAIGQVKGVRAAKYSNYMLTELGKEKAEEYGGTGSEYVVLNDLNDNGPSTVREVAQRAHLEEKTAKIVLERLVSKQRVTKVAR